MSNIVVKLLGYTPDADASIPGAIISGSAFVPSIRGMKGAPSPVSTPLASVPATCQGAATLYKLDDSTRSFVGTPTKIYEAATSVWTDVSRAAAYTPNSTQRWRFAQFGNVSLAASGADTIQASVSAGAFSCVAGAPVAGIVETVGAFVFAGNISGAANQVQWAGINGYTNWTASIATQAGSDTLTATSGPITAIKRFGNSVVVYKKKSMYLGYYVGPPNIWTINSNQIPGEVGALSQEVVANIGTPENPKHIFMGADNFYLFDGAKPIPIGNNRVKEQVFQNLLQSRYYVCTAVHDRVNSLVYFYYTISDHPYTDSCVVYNYRTDQWGIDDRSIQIAFEYVSPGITYDSLGGTYSTYNSLPNTTYDTTFLNSSQILPAFVGTDNVIKTLTGVNQSSQLVLGCIGDDVKITTLTRIRPRFIITPAASNFTPGFISVAGGAANNFGNPQSAGGGVSYLTPVSMSAAGSFDFMSEARWHNGILVPAADGNSNWELADISFEFSDEISLE